MTTNQKVRFRPTSRLPTSWNISSKAEGTVLCRYKTLNGVAMRERLDIRFDKSFVLWGVPASDFEPVSDADLPG